MKSFPSPQHGGDMERKGRMNREEIVAALRFCVEQDGCMNCPRFYAGAGVCAIDAISAAADLIENQQSHIAAPNGVQVYCEKPVCPCAHCDTGWGEATARGVRSCYENCERLKEWRERVDETNNF